MAGQAKRERNRIATHLVEVEGSRVYYQVAGEEGGEPVILVHGLSASSLWWRCNVEALARHYRVYLVDLPGFGAMHFPRGRFVLRNAATWLLKWMEAVGVKRAHLIGHSMGGYICMWIAAHRPDMVSRLVLVSPAVLMLARTVVGYCAPLLKFVRRLARGFGWILLYDVLRCGPLTLLIAAQDLVTVDAREEMRAVRVPTLLVWGEEDALVPLRLGLMVRKEMVHARFVLLRGAGHACMFDRPEEFNAAVLAFLRGEEVGE